jgi:hypothetical protein
LDQWIGLGQQSRLFTWGRRQSPVSKTLFLIKNRRTDNVRKRSNCINIPSSRSFICYLYQFNFQIIFCVLFNWLLDMSIAANEQRNRINFLFTYQLVCQLIHFQNAFTFIIWYY